MSGVPAGGEEEPPHENEEQGGTWRHQTEARWVQLWVQWSMPLTPDNNSQTSSLRSSGRFERRAGPESIRPTPDGDHDLLDPGE